MGANVHGMHVPVKRECAWAQLEIATPVRHYVCMNRTLGKTYLREWRKNKAGRTLEAVAEHLHITRTQLGRIEKGQQPYNQELLEVLAELYGCSVVDLLIRDPSDPIAIWSIWERAKPAQRRQIVDLAEVVVRTGTSG